MELGELRGVLRRVGLPTDAFAILGVWPGRAEGTILIHLSPTAFWKAVSQVGGEVTSEERSDLLFPYRHRFVVDGVEFFTFSAEPVLRPGAVTPGYALRLT